MKFSLLFNGFTVDAPLINHTFTNTIFTLICLTRLRYSLFPKSHSMTQFYLCRIFLPFFLVQFFYFDKHIFRTLCLTRLRYSLFSKSHPMTQFYRCRIFCLFFSCRIFSCLPYWVGPFFLNHLQNVVWRNVFTNGFILKLITT